MRQRWWLEFLKDYEFALQYHPGKENVLADSLRRIGIVSITTLLAGLSIIEQLRDLDLRLQVEKKKICVCSLSVQPQITQKIKEMQPRYQKLKLLSEDPTARLDFSVRADGALVFKDRLCVPNSKDLKDLQMNEVHRTRYTVHPGSKKMY